MKTLCATLVLAVTGSVVANVPPDLLQYQGVLRTASGKPLSGTFAMVFRFLDGPGGNEILVDRHEGPISIVVTGGLFTASLGGGIVSDGAGPGTYTVLSQVFRDFPDVRLRLQINGETLNPDLRVLSSPYALNATYLDGVFEGQFLRSDENDTAVGKIFFAGDPSGPGVSQGSVFISPTSANPNETLLGIAVNSVERLRVDAEGEVTVTATGTYGVNAGGFSGGAHFYNSSGDAHAYAARVSTGMSASGSSVGGEFFDSNGSGYGYIGFDHVGVHAGGDNAGGAFFNTNGSGIARAGYGDVGLHASGNTAGGYFEDGDTGAHGYVGWGTTGVAGYGATQGGYFFDLDGTFARVGYSTYKINGTGAVSFVQNHPLEPDRVIVYAAPEGDEVATYTRGTARLVGGEARVRLGETFAWVTNPDVGLTAHLTPRGTWADLYVASLSTQEMVVRCAGNVADAVFDYQVWGLRIGFEESSVVQEKHQEAYVPSMTDHRELYGRHPELRRFNALERFRGMAGSAPGSAPTASASLLSAIGVHEAAVQEPEVSAWPSEREAEETRVGVPLTEIHRVLDAVQVGDVLVVDPEDPGALRLAREPGDVAVVGIVSGEAAPPLEGHAAIALGGTVLCNVDADFAPVDVGDLLMTSATPGHAMRTDGARPGTVLGKALEPLPAGRGVIRVLVMLR